jgi:hypothetical protein
MERARIEVEEDGRSHSVKVGDAIDLEVEDIVPFGVENGQPARDEGRLLHLEVLLGRLTAAPALRRRGNAGQTSRVS